MTAWLVQSQVDERHDCGFTGCWVIEKACKYVFAELEPKPLITRGRERREARRREQARVAEEKKAQ